ncbi:MAG TPA: sulfurtransferase TusA family protein [Acidobacteriota bacterium]|nr:sulfurtransferase TusA family protein [Acidobacteriota bacterium]
MRGGADSEDQIKIENLISDMKTMRARGCGKCGAAICGHEALMSFSMGFKDSPKCRYCLSVVMETGRHALRDHLFSYIRSRSCQNEGWLWANREEGFGPDELPGCLWPQPAAAVESLRGQCSRLAAEDELIPEIDPLSHAEWDAGDMACGDLVLELRTRLHALKSGQTLKVIATDRGAPQDIPAWCRMTGHALFASRHPAYWIRRKAG